MAKNKNSQLNERRWIRSILDKYDDAEKLRPKLPGLDEEWPDWVNNLYHILMGASHPGLRIKQAKQWTAKDLGAFLGRQSALEALLWGEVPLSAQVQKETADAFVAMQKTLAPNSGPTLSSAIKKYKKDLVKWRPVFKKFIDEAVTSARARPYTESTAFLSAFGKAVVIKPNDLAVERTIGVGERIAWVMVSMWRTFERFETVAQLHFVLAAAAKRHGVIITLKRVEKLCSRIGLKFKGRGRPKKK